jgi:multidrug resistance efflux pump
MPIVRFYKIKTKENIMQRRPPLLAIIVLVVLVISAGVYYIFFANRQAANSKLTASGSVEAVSVSIAPELSGKVAEVKVDKGQSVKAGDVLFTLDDVLLKAQRDAAAASLEISKAAVDTANASVAVAQAQYDSVLDVALVQDKTNRTVDWYKGTPGDFTLSEWYYSQTEQLTAAQTEVDAAKTAFAAAQKQLVFVQQKATSADFVKAEGDLAAAQASYLVANNLYNRTHNGKNIDEMTRRQVFLLARDARLIANAKDPRWVTLGIDQDLRDAAQTLYDDAKSNLKDAQTAYDDAVTTEGADDVMKARAKVSIAQERYYTARDYARILQTGADAPPVTSAQKVLEQAQMAAAQAQKAVGQAQANLDLLDAQTARTIVTAPSDGVILSRNVEPGEVVNPGSVVFTLGRLTDLTLTVYIPEDRYGEISLGQTVDVSVDSFPGQTFKASVTEISNQAEFTPRNVQTTEGRKSTVFAIKLSVQDPTGKLKPGMPADVTFK